MEEKKCSKCGEVKPISEYGMLRGKVGGMSFCKVCNKNRYKIYNQENSQQEKQRGRKKDRTSIRCINFDLKKEGKRCCPSCKKTYELNKFIIKEVFGDGRIHYGFCKVCNVKNSLEYRNKNLDEFNKKRRIRYSTDGEYRFSELVRSHLKGVKNRQEFKDLWDDVRKDYDEKGITYHIDHIVPQNWFLSRTPKYLINHLDNLQVIDAEYNLSKQDRWSDPVPSDYLDKIRPYIKKEYLGLLKSL